MKENISSVIIESMSDGLIVFNFHGQITHMNPAASEMLGINMEEIKDKTYFQLFMGEPGNDRFNDLILDGIQKGETRLYGEVPFRTRDGRFFDFAVTTSFLRAESEDEEKAGIVVVFKNITEFKALDRARERVLNHLAHELRTPLSITLASLKKLQSSQNERSIERITRNLERLQDIQVKVEDIVKQGTRKKTPENLYYKSKLQNVNLGEHIQNAVEATRRFLSHRSVALLTQIKVDCHIMIDPDVLDMTLMSLLKNAVENTPDGGEATISLYRQPQSVVIEVKDTGVGITEQSQKHIFGGFYHSLETDLYSTKKPYDFGAGGKGLDLLRIKMFGKTYHFTIECKSDRCRYIPREIDACPGSIAKCVYVDSKKQCAQSGGSVFKLVF
ncbi:MAG: PAS domain S-box protein [Desulfobacterales bacterium]|jgi:two-component system phosphate regulon sensor histidine kinase PhoR